MSYIKEKDLQKISLFVIVSAIVGVFVNNYFIYPSFTRLVQKNTENEAIRVAKHISTIFFPEENSPPQIPPPQVVDELANAFEFMKLKSFDPKGIIVFSTDADEIGEVNKNEYFHDIVAKGSIYAKLVKKSSLSLEGKSVIADVVEVYVPVMRNGQFVGAFELYYDVSLERGMLKRNLFSSNLLSTGLLFLFVLIILIIIVKLDKSISQHKETNKELEEAYLKLNISKSEIEKNHYDVQSAFDKISTLIKEVSRTQDVKLRFENPSYEKCYAVKKCGEKECPCFGQEVTRCWQTAGTYCNGTIQGAYAQKYDDCHDCDVFKKATPSPTEQIGELFNDMMHMLEIKQRELENAYGQLQVSQASLVRHEKMASIGTLAGGIAHEFNNILGAIIGYADMARDESPEGGQVRADLDKVLKAGERAKDLVKEILTFSRQSEQDLSPIQILPIVKEAIKLLKASTPSSVEVRLHSSSDCRPVLANATMIHQVLVNLYTNAVQAMGEKGAVEVTVEEIVHSGQDVSITPNLIPGEYVRLTIKDTGPGIDLAIQERIFDPFFTTKEVGQGTGMGLSVVHGIVEKFGGVIDVGSEPGQGASFHVYFPVTTKETEEGSLGQGSLLTGTEQILYVDDEMMLAHMGKQMLEKLGYKVLARTSSVEAHEAFRANPEKFDLVITDQTMPHISGSELAKLLMEIRPDIPVILCTGYSASISEEKAEELGIRAFVMKPVDKRMLANTIRKVLDGEGSVS